MPTYFANGVTATLATCNLQSSLSHVLELKQGAELRKDAERIRDVFDTARPLCEAPIGHDGTAHGALQFIGAHRDLPLFMVEAGEDVGKHGITSSTFDTEFGELQQQPSMPSDNQLARQPSLSDGSLLTSLGTTPTPTQLDFDLSCAGASAHSAVDSSNFEKLLRSTRSYLDSSKAQALVLNVEISHKSLLPPRSPQRRAGVAKDVKLEVFVNGDLADVAFIGGRRSAVQIVGDKVRFSGLRVHRQVEKPLVYITAPEALSEEVHEAQRRWTAVSARYSHEAELRSRDRVGMPSPSTEYCMALAGLHLPERLTHRHRIGVIDVIITLGKGKKDGPSGLYLMRPTRMADRERITGSLAIDPMLLSDDTTQLDMSAEGASPMWTTFPAPTTLPDMQVNGHDMDTSDVSPTPKTTTTTGLVKELGVDEELLSAKIGVFETARGKAGNSRTLRQRLADLAKMNVQNREKEFAKLKAELAQFTLSPTRRDSVTEQEPEKKKRRLRKTGDGNAEYNPSDDDVFVDHQHTMDPTHLLERSATPLLAVAPPPYPMGTRARRASTARISEDVRKTPMRRTRASALANSPTKVAVKETLRKGPVPQASQLHTTKTSTLPDWPLAEEDRSMPQPPKIDPASPTRSDKGGNRQWNPGEMSVADTLKTFEVPESCKGSCVSYAEDEDAMRQIGKARNGEFTEEELLVGMRFVVV